MRSPRTLSTEWDPESLDKDAPVKLSSDHTSVLTLLCHLRNGWVTYLFKSPKIFVLMVDHYFRSGCLCVTVCRPN